jgi:serine/threonine protein kinase
MEYFGKVFHAIRKSDGKDVCLNEIDVLKTKLDVQTIKKEIEVHRRLSHPNIVQYYDSFEVSKQFKHKICLILEYIDGGDLRQSLAKRFQDQQPCGEQFILKMFFQIGSAIHYCFHQHIFHRDIKPQNILLTKDGNFLLADFGVSKIIEAKTTRLEAQARTLNSMSPQMINKQPYSYKTDIWSLGCALFEIMTLHHPFETENPFYLIQKIPSEEIKEINSNHSDELKKTVLQMLIKSEDLRLNFEMFEHLSILKTTREDTSEEYNSLGLKYKDGDGRPSKIIEEMKYFKLSTDSCNSSETCDYGNGLEKGFHRNTDIYCILNAKKVAIQVMVSENQIARSF